MKQFLRLSLTFVLALLATFPTLAYVFSAKNEDGVVIYYNINSTENKTCEVTYNDDNWNSYSGYVRIPASVTYSGETYSVTSIGRIAFYECTGLTSVTIPNSVTSIGESAFQYCTGLTTVTIPNSVTSIGKQAFSNNSRLTTVTIPNTVVWIGDLAFWDCTGLKSVTSANPEPSKTGLRAQVFKDCPISSCNLYVPQGSKEAYAAANQWKDFGNIAEIATEATSITMNTQQLALNVGDSKTLVATVQPKNAAPSVVWSSSDPSIAYVNSQGDVLALLKGTATITATCGTKSASCKVTVNGTYDIFARNEDGVIIYYNVLSSVDKTCAVTYKTTKYDSYSGTLKIPDSVTYSGNTYSVTSIGPNAFNLCSELTDVTIPNSVTSIGDCTFKDLTGLTTVIIGNSVTSIGESDFQGCTGLQSVTIGNSVESIGNYAFADCEGLKSITIPNSVTSIGNNAFADCKGLTSVTIPNSVTSIGNNAFEFCYGLTSVTIPNSVKSIGDGVFSYCTSLKSITIPNSVTSIGEGAFYYCKGLTSVTIPMSVNTIGKSAFYNTGLTSVNIPNSSSIGNYAFSSCTSLTSLTIGNTPTSLGYQAFYGCSGLTSVKLEIPDPSQITLGHGVFGDVQTSSCKLYVPKGSKELYAAAPQWSAFNNIVEFSEATSITLNKQKLTLKVGGSETLVATVLPEDAMGIIGWSSSSPSVASVNAQGVVSALSEGTATITATCDKVYAMCKVTVIDASAACDFSATNEDGVEIYYNIKSADDKTCEVTYKDKNYKSYSGSVKIPASVTYSGKTYSVTSIGENAFNKCSELTSVAIPNSVTSLSDKAFMNCSGLTTVTIPNSVTSIGVSAFYNCTGLTTVTIPNSVTSIGDYAFYFCTGLTTVTISNSVTSIGSRAFFNCSGLTTVTIPNSVTSIGDYAFSNCAGLTSVTIPNSVTSIGNAAFEYCSSLTSVTIPNSVTSIGNNAFDSCTGLKSITIPNSVTSIGNYAFADCNGLTSITSANPDPSKITLGTNVFYRVYTGTLYVPRGSKDAYATAPQWSVFYIEETDITGIEDVISDGTGTYVVYDLNGILKLTTTDFAEISSTLDKGIYIINGKKVLIK